MNENCKLRPSGADAEWLHHLRLLPLGDGWAIYTGSDCLGTHPTYPAARHAALRLFYAVVEAENRRRCGAQ